MTEVLTQLETGLGDGHGSANLKGPHYQYYLQS